jgi:hypothetical protein
MALLDLVMLLLVAVAVMLMMKREAGFTLMALVAAAVSLLGAHSLAPHVTTVFGWPPLRSTGSNPLAFGLTFGTLWSLGLLYARSVHRDRRWTADQFDPYVGVVCGLAVALIVGHVFTQVIAGASEQNHGRMPDAFANSLLAEEFRSFRAFRFVMNEFVRYQNGG